MAFLALQIEHFLPSTERRNEIEFESGEIRTTHYRWLCIATPTATLFIPVEEKFMRHSPFKVVLFGIGNGIHPI